MFKTSIFLINLIVFFCFSNFVNVALADNLSSHKKPQTNQFAYITYGQGYKTPSILKCAVNATGDLSNCNETASGSVFGPTGTVFNNGVAYIANSIGARYVTQCQIDNTSGELNNCFNKSDPTFSWLSGIAISNGHLYLVNHNSRIIQCTITKDGISNCNFTGNPAITAVNIAIKDNYAYISNGNAEIPAFNVLRCPIQSDGNLSNNCVATNGFSTPYGIAFNNKYAYVTDSNTASQYTIDAAGHLIKVKDFSFKKPVGITFNNGYAYIANYNADDGNGTISKCSVDQKTGNLVNCQSEVHIDYASSITIH